MTAKTCLVTGGAGFIGCAASRLLADRYARVVAIDSLHPQVHREQRRPRALDRRVQLVIGDVTVSDTWNSVLATIEPDVILHLAAETGTGQSLHEATRHAHANVVGTTQMLDALGRHRQRPSRILLTSSRAIYGEGAWRHANASEQVYPGQRSRAQLERQQWDFPDLEPVPFDASRTEPRPISVYGSTKLAQEQILRAWSCALGVEAIVMRLQNVYGPGQSLHNPYTGICSFFAQTAREGRSIPVYEDGRIVRDFVYIDDVVTAIMLALEKGSARTAYDVGAGVATTIADLASAFATYYGAPAPHVNGAFRHGDVRHAACSIEHTVADLGWRPKVSLRDGIGRLCGWIDSELQPAHHAVAAA